MDGFWLTPDGSYYQGDQASHLDIAVPPRPDQTHVWVNGAWEIAPPSSAEVQAMASSAVQGWLDQTAQGFQFDSILSAVSYADDPTNALWQKQGQAFRTWRTSVWQALYAMQQQIKAGTLAAPTTPAALLAALPQPNIPAA